MEMSMASEKQIAANRRNAQKSTGPRTEAGKAVARYNALTHGLSAELAVLPGESAAEFAALQNEIFAQLSPQNALQAQIVADLVGVQWRLRRIPRWLAALAAHHMLQNELLDFDLDAVRAAKARVTERLKKQCPDRSTEDIHALLKLGERLIQDGLTHHEKILRYERALRREGEFLLKQLENMNRDEAATVDHDPLELDGDDVHPEDAVGDGEAVAEATPVQPPAPH
jgi:hypothetical protein